MPLYHLNFYIVCKISKFLQIPLVSFSSQRDIWRRGGLDSISEDEEEEDDVEQSGPGSNMNHVTHGGRQSHYFGNGTHYNRKPRQNLTPLRKPNNFNSPDGWLGKMKYGPKDWMTRLNHVEKQPLLSPEEESASRPQSPRSLIRQLAVDVNASPNKENNNNSPDEGNGDELLSSQSLEWEQVSFAPKHDARFSTAGDENDGESFEMKSKETGTVLDDITEEAEHDEIDKRLSYSSSHENRSTENSSQRSSDSPIFTKKISPDFSNHLYLACGDAMSDERSSLCEPDIAQGDRISDGSNEWGKPDWDQLGLQKDDAEIGYTNFETPTSRARTPRVCPSPTSGNFLNESAGHSIPSSPIDSLDDSIKHGFAMLPFRGSTSDSLRLSACNSPAPSSSRSSTKRTSSPRFIENLPRKNRERSTGRLQSHIEERAASDSPTGNYREAFSRPSQHTQFRRAFTELNSPDSSCGSLNEKQPPRRRKVSAVIQPPCIFAPLVANANNPYKDFVPPIRETAITCDREPAEGSPLGDLSSTANGEVDCEEYLENQSLDEQSHHSENDFAFSRENLQDTTERRNVVMKSESGDSLPSRLTSSSEIRLGQKTSRTDPSQDIGESSFHYSSTNELPDCFDLPFLPYSNAHGIPILSGAYSSHCVQQADTSKLDLATGIRPMRTSFSEPHLLLRHPVMGTTGQEIQQEQEDNHAHGLASPPLEDIFQDVTSTRAAIEKLHSILNAPEHYNIADLADTRRTVQNLGNQVFSLNKEVASLGADVKTVLELLKGLQNGHV